MCTGSAYRCPCVNDVVVDRRTGAGACRAQPLKIVDERFAAEEPIEKLHDALAADDALQRVGFEMLATADRRAGDFFAIEIGDALDQRCIWIGLAFISHDLENVASRLQNFLGIVQSTNQQIAVVLHSLPERLGIVADVVALRQVEGEILGFRLEVTATHFIFHDIDEDETNVAVCRQSRRCHSDLPDT